MLVFFKNGSFCPLFGKSAKKGAGRGLPENISKQLITILYSEVFYILVESTFFTLFLRVIFVLFLACILLGMNKIDGFFQND